MIQPLKLNKNDKAIIISPAGNVEPQLVHEAALVLRNWGLDVSISPNCLSKSGRFSGTKEQRLLDLQSSINNKDVKLILCSRGGYGVVHLLGSIDFSGIVEYPKWVVGFSDITALHSTLQSNGIISIHGPMAKDISQSDNSNQSIRYLRDILFGENINYKFVVRDTEGLNRNGKCEGDIFGGNLAVFCGLMGTDKVYLPKNGILILEDIGEAPYKVDRYIQQLKLAGIFDSISGLIIGQFTEFEEDDLMPYSLYETIAETLSEYDFPVCFNFPFGHIDNNHPVLLGKRATLTVKDEYINFKQRLF